MDCYPGIYKRKAVNSDYSTFSARQQTFEESNEFNKSLAKAGLYRTGYADCVRCFHCGLTSRGLEPDDNVWAQHEEHCEFLKLHKGEKFILRARDMDGHEVTMDEDKDLESTDSDQMIIDLNSRASQMMMDRGHTQEEIEHGILKAREKYGNGELKAANILEYLFDNESIKTSRKIDSTEPSSSTNSYQTPSSFAFSKLKKMEPLDEDHKKLLEENHLLKNRMACKICLDASACILFVPCGHMVSCKNCSSKLKICAVCRADITNTIRTYPA